MTIKQSTIERSELLDFIPLQDASKDDQHALRLIRNEPDIRKNMYNDHMISVEEHDQWLASISSRSKPFLIFDHGALIGFVGFSEIDQLARKANWAFYLSANAHGKGYGSATEYFALQHAFGQLKLNKLNCEVIAWNRDVIALHKRFGFVEEGIRRSHVWRANAFHDVVLLGLLADEWHKLQPDLRK